MQQRHRNNDLYFSELDETCRKYYIPYLESFTSVENKQVFEIGCGQGGNLLPFYEKNCNVTGVDFDIVKIEAANQLFASKKNDSASFEFKTEDFFKSSDTKRYDIILVHDVIEHIEDKEPFMRKALQMLAEDGTLFYRFPAWQMPFGGHQQICSRKICSVIPFTHLLPAPLYKTYLKLFKENDAIIDELLFIKRCRMPIEKFEKLTETIGAKVLNRRLWFINPHYKVKFGLTPRRLSSFIAGIYYFRNFFTTSCYYLLKKK